MSLMVAYLKEKRFVFLGNFLMYVFFTVSFYLYQLPLAAVFYPYLVCVAVGLVFVVFDFRRFKNKHHILRNLKQNIEITNEIDFVPRTVLENDCIEIIYNLLKQRRCMQDDFTAKYTDMTQYYTVWVHQIKTPIAAMRLMLQNEDSGLSRKLSTDLFRIERYVQMVMVYLRAHADSTDYLFTKCSLDTIIKQAVKSFSTEFIEKKIALHYQSIEQSVMTDEKWFLFLLEQIISNALKYTQKGSVQIYQNGEGALCIEDSGMGIAAEDLPRIFENGYTGTIGRIDKKSSGIGLYLCKTVSDKLNIKLSAQSVVGKGTTMKLGLRNLTNM